MSIPDQMSMINPYALSLCDSSGLFILMGGVFVIDSICSVPRPCLGREIRYSHNFASPGRIIDNSEG